MMLPNFDQSFTISKLAKLTGAKKRTLQFQTLHGALKCDPSTLHEGRGVSRRYSVPEAAVAAMLAGIAEIPISISEVILISEAARHLVSRRRLEAPEQAESRRKKVLDRHGGSLAEIWKQGGKAHAALDEAVSWEGFVKALHGISDVGMEVERDHRGVWSVHFQPKGVRVNRKASSGPSKLRVGFRSDDAAELFCGILG